MKKNRVLRTIASGTMVSSLVLSAMSTPIRAVDGWTNENGSWTYISGGTKTTGWGQIGNSWFSFDGTGKMLTGWVASDQFWYWLSPTSGVMQERSWVTDSTGNAFYLEANGVMATDTVKDGYEIKSDGTRILLSESNSVVLTSEGLPEGSVIEGNLYITKEAAKDMELKGITVKGKIVIEGGETVKLTDSNVSEIKLNQAGVTVVLSGKTEVDNVTFTKEASLTGDKDYKGEVKTVDVTSLVKNEATIGVKAESVSTRSWAPLAIEKDVKNLTVENETEIKIGKDVTVAKVEANAPSTFTGEGKVTELGANSKGVQADVAVGKITGDNKGDVTNTDGGVVEKPSTGGSSGGSSGGSGGGGNTDTETDATLKAKLEEAIKAAVGPTNVKLQGIAILTVSGKQVNVEFANQTTKAIDVLNNDFLGELFTYADIKSVTIGGKEIIVPANATDADKKTFSFEVMKQVATTVGLTDLTSQTLINVLHGKEVAVNLNCTSASGKAYSDTYTVNFIDPIQKLEEAVSAAVGPTNILLTGIATLTLNKDEVSITIEDTATLKMVYESNFLAEFFNYEEIYKVQITGDTETVEVDIAGEESYYAIMFAVAQAAGLESSNLQSLASILRGEKFEVTLYGKTESLIEYEKEYTVNF